MKTVEFYYDFGSPNAYFVDYVLGDLCARNGAELIHKPFLLGGVFKLTNNTPPMMAFGGVKHKLAYQQREIERFIERFDIPFKFNPHFPVMTTLAMRAALVTHDTPDAQKYRDTVFRAIWVEELKMDDPEVVAETLAGAGFDAEAILEQAASQPIKDALFAATQAAVDRGTFGAPMMFVGDEPFFGKDSLPDLERELQRA